MSRRSRRNKNRPINVIYSTSSKGYPGVPGQGKERRGNCSHISAKDKAKKFMSLFQRDGDRCHYCNKEIKPPVSGQREKSFDPDLATLEHIVPAANGGVNANINLVLVCNQCNNDRGSGPSPCNCSFCKNAHEMFGE